MATTPVLRPKDYDMLLKLIIIGDSGVGKTNLMTKYCDGEYKDSYVATIGVDFKLTHLTLDNTKMKMQVWDTAGQERFRNITATYYKGASGIVLTYAINDKQSFQNLEGWMRQVDSTVKEGVKKILVGTKTDLEEKREVTAE